MIRGIVDWVRLTRLPNALVAGLSVWLGRACLHGHLGGGHLEPPGAASLARTALGSAAMALLAASGNVHNDLLDLDADRVNRPGRVLVTGRVSPRGAALGAALLCLAALACGFAVDANHGVLTTGMALLLA